jgi:hypothetical protein
VRDLATYRDYVYALSEESLDIYDRTLEPLGSVPVDGGMHLVVTGDSLVLAAGRRLLRYSLARPLRPARTAAYPVAEVADLLPIGQRDAVFIREPTGGGTVLDLSTAGVARPMVMYKQTPWFIGHTSIGRLVGRLGENNRQVTIYDASRTAQR